MRRGLSNHAGTASEQWLAAVRLLCSSHVGTPSRRSAHKREWGLRFLDVGSMVLQLPPKLNFLPAQRALPGPRTAIMARKDDGLEVPSCDPLYVCTYIYLYLFIYI